MVYILKVKRDKLLKYETNLHGINGQWNHCLFGKLVSKCVMGEFPEVLEVTCECYLMAFSFGSVSAASSTVVTHRVPEWFI